MTWRWLSKRAVLAIHAEQLAEHGGAPGIRDEGLLDSALARSARGAISTPRSRPTRTASPSARSSPRRTRATPSGSATSRSASTRSATCRARGAISTPRSRPTRTASPSPRSSPRRTRATPGGSATSRSASTGSATCRARGAISTPRSRPTRTASTSALARARHRAADAPPDAADLAASYGYGIVSNHPFVDGNKRTGFVAGGHVPSAERPCLRSCGSGCGDDLRAARGRGAHRAAARRLVSRQLPSIVTGGRRTGRPEGAARRGCPAAAGLDVPAGPACRGPLRCRSRGRTRRGAGAGGSGRPPSRACTSR